jgi:predicted AlkP superfamily phosphohydrolase/phosphomutase
MKTWRMIVVSILALGVFAMGYVLLRDRKAGTPPIADTKDGALRYASWDEFRSSGPVTQKTPHQVVFIGIDAAVWHFMDRLIARGDLPNIARIKNEGTYGPLRSVGSSVTPPAWTSMLTGYLPNKTGIYTFGKWQKERQEFMSVHSEDVRVPFVWDAASQVGRKVAVINVPMTFPAHPVNGIMVTGQMTPIDLNQGIVANPTRPRSQNEYWVNPAIRSYSAPFATTIEDTLNRLFVVFYDTVDDGQKRFDTVSMRVVAVREGEGGGRELGKYTFKIHQYSPWLTIRYVMDGVVKPAHCKLFISTTPEGKYLFRFSETLFPIEGPYTYPGTLADVLIRRYGYFLPTKFVSKEFLPSVTEDAADYARFFYDYDDWDLFAFVFTQTDNAHHLNGFDDRAAEIYSIIDRLIGDIMARMPKNSTLIVASDHGSGEFDYGIDLNQLLAQLRLLQWSNEPDIDYGNTLVFHNLSFLYFNYDLITREELSRRGFEVPAGMDPVEFVVEYLSASCRDLRSAGIGRAFPIEFERVSPGFVGDPPHLMVQRSYEDYYVLFWNIMVPHGSIFGELHGTERFWHVPDGVYMVWGDGVRRGHDAGLKPIQDIGPTILYLLGVPAGPEMDGKIMMDAFHTDFLADQHRYVVDTYDDIPKEIVLEGEERESLRKKLRSLGYIQ